MHPTRKLRRTTLTALVLTGLLALYAAPVLAATPANDDFDSAVVIPGIPYSDALDTSGATTSADDPDCVGQGPTVWYTFTPSTDMRLAANTFGSDYDTTLSVYNGSRGALIQIACNDDAFGLQSQVAFDALAGETYYFMVGAFAGGPGGNLVFYLDIAGPPLEFGLDLNPTGSVKPSTGIATMSGTVFCSKPAFVQLFGQLEQRAGRVIIRGFFGDTFDCDGVTPWSVTVSGDNGLFAGGRATFTAEAIAFSQDGDFGYDFESLTVRLTGARR